MMIEKENIQPKHIPGGSIQGEPGDHERLVTSALSGNSLMINHRLGKVLLVLCLTIPAMAQTSWEDREIDDIFALVKTDVPAAISLVEKKVSAYDFGIELLEVGKGDMALEWFRLLTIATNKYKHLYGLAWTKWKTGDYDGALKDALYLSKQDLEPLLAARTFYMLGSLCIESRIFDDARVNLNAGLETYRTIDKYGGQHICLILLAAVEVYEGNFDKVMPLLDQALEADRKNQAAGYNSYGMGPYFDIKSEMHFWTGDYRAALEANQLARSAYLEKKDYTAADGAFVKIGILKFILGEPREAHAIAVELWNRYNNTTGSRILAYNNVLLAKLSQCGQDDEDYQARVDGVRTWAQGKPGGQMLLDLQNFVLDKVPCPEIQE